MRSTMTIAAALLALAGCVDAPRLDICKYAAERRAAYTATITAADIYVATHETAPQALTLGRQAAVTALAVLDTNCPTK